MTVDGDARRHARQVRAALERDYTSHVYAGDLQQYGVAGAEQRLLSRALTALAVRIVAGVDPVTAGGFVIDGIADQGIDGIALRKQPPHVYLVQAKWSDIGAAKIDREAARELVSGLDYLDRERFSEFNARGEALGEAASVLMVEGNAPVTLVIALMGTAAPGPNVIRILDDAMERFNQHGPRLKYCFLHAQDFSRQVRKDREPEPITLHVTLTPWHQHDGLHSSFQGSVRVEDVAAWSAQYGAGLFRANIRDPLGSTRTNSGIVQSLITEPGNFWYRNNGITVLCESIEARPGSMQFAHNSPMHLTAVNASVVNGAQTVNAIAEAMRTHPEITAQAKVGVRVIATNGATGFAEDVTKATNLQNSVEARDFIALDPVQSEIREDFAADLNKQYTIKRGAPDPSPEAGCSIVEAAAALACLHPAADYSARLARSLDPLWERGERGAYDVLFDPRPSALQVWRAVIAVRAVRKALHATRSQREGRAAAVAQHSEYLIAHLVLKHLGVSLIDEHNYPWEDEILPRVADTVAALVPWLIHHADAEYGADTQIRTLLANPEQTRHLSLLTLASAETGKTPPTPPAEYTRAKSERKPRRPNTVPYLVDAHAIAEGTPLVYYSSVNTEQVALAEWLAEDPRRSRATWVNSRTKPILWEADQRQHSPSGLIREMWQLADWKRQPVANQGTTRWLVNGDESLWALALRLQEAEEATEPDLTA
ncbi:abortive phage infection protein [Amycolatopsis sp. WAC 04182]|uniref:AIPR family protein n=1 Tax=Amycolatopsis sp. WAC 04182 TaxID=2203198 RepID=UPI000F7853BF|nr:AIPR family protein [Amycolatopsis sp. WAC 04182]RSN66005.1 abortive phage infection protein [Amycolatopsis sp. WAC 04182]